MPTVLITGGGGFAGAHLIEHLLANTGWDIVSIDSFRHRGDSLRCLNSGRVQTFAHDLTAPISARLSDRIGEVDFVVNMAAESHVDRSIEEPDPFIRNNVALAINMLEYARQAKPLVFIQISTDEVYGAALDGQLHAEWSPILPSNPYAASKAAQEAIAISYWRTYGVPVVLSNTMNMFGERQDREKYIPMLIQKIQAGETVTIHGTAEAIGSRFYLHARNHADALLWMLKRPCAEYSRGALVPDRWNVVGESEIDNLTLAQMVAGILGKELKYELVDFHAARPGHDRRYALDGRKIADAGWVAPVPFDESLRRAIEWTLAHPEWMLPYAA